MAKSIAKEFVAQREKRGFPLLKHAQGDEIMAKTYLLEIGLEEMPAHVVTPSVLQLKERMIKFLKDARLDFEDVKTFSTPRRLTVQVLGLAGQAG